MLNLSREFNHTLYHPGQNQRIFASQDFVVRKMCHLAFLSSSQVFGLLSLLQGGLSSPNLLETGVDSILLKAFPSLVSKERILCLNFF